MELKIYKLGDLITQRREKYDGTSDVTIIGVSKSGIIPPKQIDADITLYNQLYLNDFLFNPARMELNSIAFNDKYQKAICSSLYEIFYVSRIDLVIPEYLKLFVKRDEFARHCEFLGSGSAREYCRFANISEIEIELPSIKKQEKIVNQHKVIENRIKTLQCLNSKLYELIHAQYLNVTQKVETFEKIKNIGQFVRGKNITSEEMIAGEIDVVSAGIMPSGKHNEWNVKSPSITISGSGANAGYFSIHYNNIWAADCSYCNDNKYIMFLLESLNSIKDEIEGLKDGNSAQPHVYAKDINELKVKLPDYDKLIEFELRAKKIASSIYNNIEEIKQLEKIKIVISQTI